MAEIVWMEPALSDLERITEYIALHNRDAAERLAERVFRHVEQLKAHPESGSFPLETSDRRYRQIIEPPCRIFYRYDGTSIYIIYVMRSEQKFRRVRLKRREKSVRDDR